MWNNDHGKAWLTEFKCIQSFGGGDERRDHLEDKNLEGKTILRWSLERRIGLIWLSIGIYGGLF